MTHPCVPILYIHANTAATFATEQESVSYLFVVSD